MPAASIPIDAGGPLTGKAGKFSVGALNVQTGEDRAANVDAANFTVAARQARHPAPQQRRRDVHPPHDAGRPAGSNDGYGADATFSFFQNLRMDTYIARHPHRRPEQRRSQLPRPVRLQRRQVRRAGRTARGRPPTSIPEIGFVRRLDMRRNYGLLRYSPRPRGIPHVRKFSFQGSLNYTTNTTNRLDTREAIGQFQTEFTNSDLAIVSYTPHFERLVVPFQIAPGVRLPGGRLRLSHQRTWSTRAASSAGCPATSSTRPARSTTAHARRSASARRASR